MLSTSVNRFGSTQYIIKWFIKMKQMFPLTSSRTSTLTTDTQRLHDMIHCLVERYIDQVSCKEYHLLLDYGHR